MDMPNASSLPPRIQTASLPELLEYIVSTFFPIAQPMINSYPRLVRFVGLVVGLYYFSPVDRLTALWTQLSSFITSTVTVRSNEDIFEYLASHLSQPTTRVFRPTQSLIVVSNIRPDILSRFQRHSSDSDDEPVFNGPTDPNTPPLKYMPSQGLHVLIHNHHVFLISHTHGDGYTYSSRYNQRIEDMTITCLGRSPDPIKAFLNEVHAARKASEESLTIIRRPYENVYRGDLAWSRVTAKPHRALDTVILDGNQKSSVVNDISEYMSHTTRAFYASHGIPYRRGYLFHGPPGVGKTSFALALASKFQMDVYAMTLLDRRIGDSDLITLFQRLPGRSLLLLEDIDTAGLNRRKHPTRRRYDRMPFGGSSSDESDDQENDIQMKKSKVSLSGLLNAIDGVAAPEGHVLIMTTNKPDDLDEVLVRAGRVSVRVAFQNASKLQAEEMFLRMFDALPDEKVGTRRIQELSEQFSRKMEDHELSPADLQDYLLVHKKEPVRAVEQFDDWKKKWQQEKVQREKYEEDEMARRKEKKNKRAKKLEEELEIAVAGANEKMKSRELGIENSTDIEHKKGNSAGGDDELQQARTERAEGQDETDESDED